MAKYDVYLHGKETVSTAADSAGKSIRQLRENIKDTVQPAKDLYRGIQDLLAFGGLAVAVNKLVGELGQAEQAFAKLHPELAKMPGSLQEWTRSTDSLKSAIGGLVTAALSPLRSVLISLIDPWARNIQAAADFTIMLHRLNQQGKEGQDLASRLAAAEARKTELLAAQARARITEGSTDLSQIGYFARGATSSSFVTDYAKAIEDLDKEIAALTAQLKEDTKKAEALLKPPEKKERLAIRATATAGAGAGISGEVPLSTLDIMQWYTRINTAFGIPEGQQQIAREMEEAIGRAYEDPMRDMTAAAGQFTRGMQDVAAALRATGGLEPGYLQRLIEPLATAWQQGMTGMVARGADPLGLLFDAVGPLIASLGSIQALLDPLTVILNAAWNVVAPMVNTLLAPLVGILVILGQTLGAMIVPALQALEPVITFLAEGFVWLYNNAIMPIANSFMFLFTILKALGQFIWYLVTFQWGKVKSINVASQMEAGALKAITLGNLATAGAAEIGAMGGYAGGSTTIQRAPDIYIYQTFEGPVVADGGLAKVGEYCAEAISAYLGTGVRVHWMEG